MCTLVIFRNVFPGRPIVVAANRDERFSRPAAPPTVKDGTLAPTDRERGGTWIGVNDRGILVAITNRESIPSVRGLRSRGELVRGALEAPTADHALASVMNRDPEDYNAFNLAIVGVDEGYHVIGNGVGGTDVDGDHIEPGFKLGPLAPGINIITNLGCGPGSPRANAILRAIRMHRADQPPPRPSSLDGMLNLHEGEIPGEGFYGRRLEATCLHPTDEDPDYGTVSSAIIRLNIYPGRTSAWEYWHRDRPKGKVHQCSSAWDAPVELALRTQ